MLLRGSVALEDAIVKSEIASGYQIFYLSGLLLLTEQSQV
jgi:hypothetical protein